MRLSDGVETSTWIPSGALRSARRAGEVDEAADPGPVLAVASLDDQGGEVAGPHQGVDDLAVDDSGGRKGLIRRIAEGPGDGAAPGLAGPQIDPHILDLAAEGGGQAQEVALPTVAQGADGGRLGPGARDVGLTGQFPAPVLLAEVFQQFDVGAEGIDVDGQRGRTRRLQ